MTIDVNQIPRDEGTYILSLWCPRRVLVEVGKLGECEFRRGYHYYVGSAFGPGGLRARVRHHVSPVSRPHWHLDYLHKVMIVKSVHTSCAPVHLEHDWAGQVLEQQGVTISVQGFGCSDCSCESHLFFSRRQLDLAACVFG